MLLPFAGPSIDANRAEALVFETEHHGEYEHRQGDRTSQPFHRDRLRSVLDNANAEFTRSELHARHLPFSKQRPYARRNVGMKLAAVGSGLRVRSELEHATTGGTAVAVPVPSRVRISHGRRRAQGARGGFTHLRLQHAVSPK